MNKPILFKNALLIDPKNEREFIGSILTRDGNICEIFNTPDPNYSISDCEIIDCNNHTLSPGLIDMWVFVGEPGYEHIETIEDISDAAKTSGVTSIACRPDTNPIVDEAELVEYIKRKSIDKSEVNIYPIAALTKKHGGETMTEMGSLIEAGALGFSDAYNFNNNTNVLKNAFTYASNYDALILQNSNSDLDKYGVVNESELSMRLGLPGVPKISEAISLERELMIAEYAANKYHSICISTRESYEIIKRYKDLLSSVTCGISINNLKLNENDIGTYRTFFKVRPLLRSEADRSFLLEHISNDIIDVITSNHDPQGTESKRLPFEEAEYGAVGIETLLSASLSLYHEGHISLPKLIKKLTYNPAKILNLDNIGSLEVGKKADLILFDKDIPWVLDADNLKTKCKNTTFENQKMQGKVLLTMVGGNIIHSEIN
jgi:dihydroorotase